MKPNRPAIIPFTKKAFEKIKAKFKSLTSEREEVIVRLQTAREMGDLSENGAYKYAKFELGSIGRQLRTLRYELRYGKVVKPKRGSTVGFGSHVTLEKSKKKLRFIVVSDHESNPAAGKLSSTSPIGRAIIGKKKGDLVTVSAPAGKTTYTIVSVK